MPHRNPTVVQAWLDTPLSGMIELAQDWRQATLPNLHIEGAAPLASLSQPDALALARAFGYLLTPGGWIHFFLFTEDYPEIDPWTDRVFLAGDFNGWQYAVGDSTWELQPASLEGQSVLVWCGRAEPFLQHAGRRFKLVTSAHEWLPAPRGAMNAVRDDLGNINRNIDPLRTGAHLLRFTLRSPLDLSRTWRVGVQGKGAEAGVVLRPDGSFFRLRSDLPLGALVGVDETTFRLFAPRASAVSLLLSSEPGTQEAPLRYPLTKRTEFSEQTPLDPAVTANELRERLEAASTSGSWQGVWEVTLNQNLHGWYYWYQVEGPSDCFGLFSQNQRILDPYALASVGRDGPGIVLDRASLGKPNDSFRTPDWQDLVIAEAHVRDLVRHAPVPLGETERLGFSGLKRWVESPDFYLSRLGVNCVELQPIHENDAVTRGEYAWGYMPVSWFAPASSFASNPADGSAITEFRDLVAAFHSRGIAVIVDVVFNHQGVPAHLMFVDKLYYFCTDKEGRLSNWSGCGNDFRASSAMAGRLIVDSCLHMIDVFGIDGFRFDLAELLGIEVLQEIERALKTRKRDVILIAEPWSFRGHIAGALATTGWSSWNDGYRNFMREAMRGGGSAGQLEYFLKGSPWYFARWPAQTVNYTESHDDRTWIDLVTEREDGNGFSPTAKDRRRTHLMTATLFCSLGIPMISSGQDFLRSKHGVGNTYLRGDLNALDYRRIHRFSGTHAYFAAWIAFRLSPAGRLLRQWSRPSEGFFRSFSVENQPALALLFNADSSQGPDKLLFALNTSESDVSFSLPADVAGMSWTQIADHERFDPNGLPGVTLPVKELLELGGLSCSLWRA